MKKPPPALRIVHLAGGLRAFDVGSPGVIVGVTHDRPAMSFPTPPYAKLDGALRIFELRPVGVDFLVSHARAPFDPPDFESLTFEGGFSALHNGRAWSDVKNVDEQRTPELVDISSRFATFHRLLTLRMREISEAYNGCLVAQLTDIDGHPEAPVDRQIFSNGFQAHIEAAIHAFLADAAGSRDLIAEAVWRLLLKEPTLNVTTLATLLNRIRARTAEHHILTYLSAAGADGGWLKSLTAIRNSVIHIAPLANVHEMQAVQMRIRHVAGAILPSLHYPLLQSDGSLRERPEAMNFEDEEVAKAQLARYREYVDGSWDALDYASETFRRLVLLAAEIREAAGIRHQIRTMTQADIIGPIRFARTSGRGL